MYEWRNAKVNANARKAFELATDISWRFADEKVRSAYLLFAALNIPDTAICKVISDMNVLLIPNIEYIIEDKESFAEIFGVEAANKVFAESEEQEASEQEEAAEEETTEEEPKDEVTAKIFEVLSGFMEVLTQDLDSSAEIMETVYSDKLELACEDAYLRCKAMKLDYLDLDVIIYSILQNKETSAYRFMQRILNSLGVAMDDFLQSMRYTANIADIDENLELPVVIPKALETCVEVLNDKYVKGEEITILGRDKEIYKAFNIFSKKTKRNAVLVGLPGVGKTAIIEAITQAIVNETCPKEFVGYTVLSLDVNSMVAGTKYRGEFETKVAILKAFLEGTRKIILFVDEMHQMLGAGGTPEGTVDLSGSLKPILSRDDVVFVGATTINEYNTILSRDGAFKRRFEVIVVNEPKRHEVKAMIKAKIKSMEKHHGVKMPSRLIDYIILCSSCFNFDNANPDKTLDLCDRSMAIAKMANKNTVTKSDINKVYEEFFAKYDKIGKKEIEATAYHEVGHYIVNRLTKGCETHNVVAISIIPTTDFLGVNILERTDNIVSCDMEYVEAYLMSLLAGRAAQFKVSKAIDSGASSDLKCAKEFAKQVIAEFGMDEGEYKNIYLLDDDLLGEKLTEEINNKVNALIKKVYEKTEIFISNHWQEIDRMAKYLMKKKIVTSDELDKFLEV